jgi:phospholipid/cholesterol/gamma-HCH transport system substrate-binding protein
MSDGKYGGVEAKVGAFFLLGLVIFGYILFQVHDGAALFRDRRVLKARFGHAGGLRTGDAVTLTGLKVGEVQKIELAPEVREGKTVVVYMELDPAYPVRKGAMAQIAWGGLLGNRLIDIEQGTGGPLPDGGEIAKTRDAIELTGILKKVEKVGGTLEEMLADEGLAANVSDAFANVSEVMEKITEGEGTLAKLLASPELYDELTGFSRKLNAPDSTLGKLAGSDELYRDAREVVKNLKDASARIDKLTGDNAERIGEILEGLKTAVPRAEEAFAEIKALGKKVDEGEGILPALLNDKEMKADLETSLDRLDGALDKIETFTADLRDKDGKSALNRLLYDEQLGRDLSDAAGSLKEVAARLEKGESTLGKLMSDREMYDKITKLLDDARETMRRVKEQVPVGTFAGVLVSAF